MVRKFTLKLACLTVLFLGTQLHLLGQEKSSWHLRQWLNNVDKDAKSELLVVLNQQLNLDSLNQAFYANKISLADRQKTTMRLLMEQANFSQGKLVKLLIDEIAKGNIVVKHAFWLVNMLTVEANEAGIKALAQNKMVNFIEKADAFGASWIAPVNEQTIAGNPESINGHEIGLERINAHKLWAKGYTGKGRRGLSVDTGVWKMHPAIQKNYLGNYFPTTQTWKGLDSYYEIDKTSSHGTHTIGTMMGLDPATSDTIGVAFGAYFLASDPIVTDISLVKPLPTVISSLEWSMNPDGDTATTDDIADVINNSWGFSTITMPNLCDSNSFVILAFKAIETAGTAIVFSAGNSGPNGPSISQPQFINPGLVNTFTIGALDGNDPTLTIADFSSRGPSICGGTGSILIKPEVSAPGRNVRSAIGVGDYGTKSGTSMAGPHVAGAVLLLKEAFPNLTGEQIKLALYYTATDLGTPGEDNVYGMGIINLDSAFNYLAQLFLPVNPINLAYDLSISSIQTNVLDNRTCDTLFSPVISILNDGDSVITKFSLIAETAKGKTSPYLWSGNLLPNQTITIPLTAISLGYNLNEVKFKVLLLDSNAFERDLINNNRIARIFVHQPTNLPFHEGFENMNFTNSKWLVNNPDFTITWDTALIDNFTNSHSAAYLNFVGYYQRNKQQDLLTSPKFNLPVGASGMSFYMSYRSRNTNFKDSLFIMISRDCGQSWNDTLYANGGAAMSTYANGFWPLDSTYWKKMWFDLSPFSNENILVRFASQNDYGGNLLIDSFQVFAGNIPSGSTFQNTSQLLKLYPNPSNGLVKICCNADQNKSTIIIRNISGAIVRTMQFNQANAELSFSVEDIAAGLYTVELRQENYWQVFKLMKH